MQPRKRDRRHGVASGRQAPTETAPVPGRITGLSAGTGAPRRPVAGLRRAARVACAALAALAALPAVAQDLAGGYFGLGDARGMRIEMAPPTEDAPHAGRFVDSNGVEAEFSGQTVGEGVEALLSFPAHDLFLRIEDLPAGLIAIAIPLAEDGTPRQEHARRMMFLRDGLAPPSRPELLQPEPRRADRVVDPDVFLASYAFWSPEGVSNGFASIGARYRTMMRMFPMLHADVLWKLCAAPGALASEQRGAALRGQGVGCEDITGTVERLQRSGEFDAWKAAANKEAEELLASVQCARGFIVKQSVCGPASQRLARAATSLRTVGTAIAPFR